MEIERITLMEAYLIETLRHAGISNEKILTTVDQGNFSVWENVSDVFDYEQLKPLYEADNQRFKRILEDGYKIKFLTFPGLQRILSLLFDKRQEQDFTLGEKGISRLKLTNEEHVRLEQLLSPNWVIENEGDNIKITLKG